MAVGGFDVECLGSIIGSPLYKGTEMCAPDDFLTGVPLVSGPDRQPAVKLSVLEGPGLAI